MNKTLEMTLTLYISREVDFDNSVELRKHIADFEKRAVALQHGFELDGFDDATAWYDRNGDGETYFNENSSDKVFPEKVFAEKFADKLAFEELDDDEFKFDDDDNADNLTAPIDFDAVKARIFAEVDA